VVCYVFHLASSCSGRSRALRGTRGRAGDSGPKRSHSPEGQHRQMLALKFLTSASCCWVNPTKPRGLSPANPRTLPPGGRVLTRRGLTMALHPFSRSRDTASPAGPPHGTEPHREITPSVDRLGSRPPHSRRRHCNIAPKGRDTFRPRRQRTGSRPNACAGTAARMRPSSSRARHRVRSTRRIASTPRGLGILPPPWRGRVQAVPRHPLLVGNPRSLRGLANAGS